MSNTTTIRAKPLPIGWLISVTTLLISLLAIYIILIGSEYGRRSTAFTRARIAAVEGNFALVDHLLQNGLKREGLTRFIPSTLAFWESDLTYSESSLRRFADLVKLVKDEKLTSAGELFRELAPEIAVSAEALGEPVEELLSKLDKLMAQAIEGYLRKRESNLEYQQAEKIQLDIEQDFTLIQREFATLLGLSFAANKSEGRFYKSGVLSGLPVINEIQDDISDLPSLGEKLKLLGAVVQTPEGVNAHRYFIDKLEDLKTRSFAIKIKLDSNNEKIKDLQNKIAAGSGKLSEATPYLVKQFSGVLLIASLNTIQEGNMLPLSIRELIDIFVN